MIKQILVLLSGILASFSIFGSDWNIVYQTDQMTDEKKILYISPDRGIFILCTPNNAGISFLGLPKMSQSTSKALVRFDKEKSFDVNGAAGKDSYTIASSLDKKFIDGMIRSNSMLLDVKDTNSNQYYKFSLIGLSKALKKEPCLKKSIVYLY
ncbi:hypothetical protein [Photobacterium phosphoreum]|uniref:hypothetical protein n=1 Tax=Photobacterium phosphoreum TaxID=659 RepID=UPI001E40E6A8|nr:hypothetical protein [Photobacterium phosphoreum]MCD9480427.1 hypothetical protein [Photobacterium phosphoreum]